MKLSFRSTRELGRGSLGAGDDHPIIIGLLDHMGYGNLGDAAVQESVIANIKKRLPKVRLVGFSLVPDDTIKRHGIPCHPILRWSPGSISRKSRLKSALKNIPIIYGWGKPALEFVREIIFWLRSFRALRILDVLIISGGGQLSELWRGPWAHPYTIFKFSLLAKVAGKKLYFLNVGAGPLKHPLSRFFARCAVQLADYRSFRDGDSQELVRSLGVRSTTYVYPDPAYGLEVGDQLGRSGGNGSPPIVGINPIGFCDSRIWPRQDETVYKAYLEKLTNFSVWLLEQGYTVRVFTTETSVDRYAIEDLKTRLLAKMRSELVHQIFRSASPGVKEVLSEMSGFDFIVTSKFHGIIFSHLLRKPVIALSYHRKMNMAMEAVGHGHFSADIEYFDVNWLIRAFHLLINESASIKLASRAAVEAFSRALSEQFDSLFLDPLNVGPTAIPWKNPRAKTIEAAAS